MKNRPALASAALVLVALAAGCSTAGPTAPASPASPAPSATARSEAPAADAGDIPPVPDAADPLSGLQKVTCQQLLDAKKGRADLGVSPETYAATLLKGMLAHDGVAGVPDATQNAKFLTHLLGACEGASEATRSSHFGAADVYNNDRASYRPKG